MINFLKCEAKAVIKLILDLSYQEGRDISHKMIEVDTNTVYKIKCIGWINKLNIYQKQEINHLDYLIYELLLKIKQIEGRT